MVECSFFINNFCHIFPNANEIEKPRMCWQKFLTLFNSITRSTVKLNVKLKLQCKVKYNDEMMKI